MVDQLLLLLMMMVMMMMTMMMMMMTTTKLIMAGGADGLGVGVIPKVLHLQDNHIYQPPQLQSLLTKALNP